MSPFQYVHGAQTIRGIRAGEDGARGLVVALHGGGYDANYWHASDRHDGSLLAVGAALGFDVLAIDRPGYHRSAIADTAGLALANQANLIFEMIGALATGRDVFLIGHSMGGILSLVMAGHARAAAGLAAIDVSGVPLRYPQEVQAGIAARIAQLRADLPAPALSNAGELYAHRRALFYGANGDFNEEFARGSGDHPVPVNELEDALNAPAALPSIMTRIRIPVQWTIADQERSSEGGSAMLDEIRSLLAVSPHVRTGIQIASGHNISLHHVARAYHLRALAFFEEVRAMAR